MIPNAYFPRKSNKTSRSTITSTSRCRSSFCATCRACFAATSGPSYTYRDHTVSELIAASLPVSMLLGSLAMLLAIVAGVGAGTLAATRRNSFVDRFVMAFSMTGISIPVFVVGPVLILAFAIKLDWVPAGWSGGRWWRATGPAGHRARATTNRIHCAPHTSEHDRRVVQPVHPHGARTGDWQPRGNSIPCAQTGDVASAVVPWAPRSPQY